MTAWGSYDFDTINAIIASVDAGGLRTVAEKWRGMADLIGRGAQNLATETERLNGSWRSPAAADLFQRNVTTSVARMGQWRQAANTRAGTLTQAASAVLASQTEMSKLARERRQKLDAAKTEAEKEAIRQEYDRLARAEGTRIGTTLKGLTPWQPAEPYRGLIGLAPKSQTNGIGFVEPIEIGDPSGEQVSDGSQAIGTSESFSVIGDRAPVTTEAPPGSGSAPLPSSALPSSALPSSALASGALARAVLLPGGGGAAGVPAVGAGLVRGLGLRGSSTHGYVPSGLYGRLAGATSLGGALAPAANTTGSSAPMIPPTGAGAAGALRGRRARNARPAASLVVAPEGEQPSEEVPGPPAVIGRPAGSHRVGPPREEQSPDYLQRRDMLASGQ